MIQPWPFLDYDDTATPQYHAYEVIKFGQSKSCGQARILQHCNDLGTMFVEFGTLGIADLVALGLVSAQESTAYSLHLSTEHELSLWKQGYCVATLEPASGTQLGLGKDERFEGCPQCAHPGVFLRTCLTCPTHGPFGGF